MGYIEFLLDLFVRESGLVPDYLSIFSADDGYVLSLDFHGFINSNVPG
jgi:hypothetical protein